ncbi:MAG: protoporphyrinogen oxidase [Acidimicrobiales bacterium]|jgi:oxygen-dependent protoporphyrinogen oxidase|nr:protoporphyrinogen oxidase [Acidimicrobiales bacterium]HJO41044.1 protoporphyrinogen oxidase [Acidimicrobiales bacterium]
MDKKKIVVVGAGVTGLTVAYRLLKSGGNFEVVVLESEKQTGGKLKTSRFAGLLLDEGADAFLARVPWAKDLFDEIGISEEFVSPSSRSASIWINGSLEPLPSPNVLGIPLDPDSLPSQLLNSDDALKIKQGGKPSKAIPEGTDVSIGSLVRDCVGDSVFELFVDPLLGGINAGVVDEMSCETMAPQLLEAARHEEGLITALREAQQNSDPESPVFYTHPNGMGHIVEKLTEQISGSIRKDSNVISINHTNKQWVLETNTGSETADAVVLATSAQNAAKLLTSVSPTSSSRLSDIEHASVSLVSFAFKNSDINIPKDQSGFLVPRSAGMLMTACSFSGNKWAHLDDGSQTLIRVSSGRVDDQRHDRLSDEELVKHLTDDLAITLGLDSQPLEFRVTRWPTALAQFKIGHSQRMKETIDLLADEAPGVFISGSYHFGVGIPASVRSGNEAAVSVIEKFGIN